MTGIKKHLTVLTIYCVVVILLTNCASTPIANYQSRTEILSKHPEWTRETKECFQQGKVCFGMNKEQVSMLTMRPNWWSRQKIGSDIYETWDWYHGAGMLGLGIVADTVDFKNGMLVGYSHKGKYHTKDKVIDLAGLDK